MGSERYFGARPIVVGGVGGSGTRLIATIMQDAGVFVGDDLNHARDNKRLFGVFPVIRERLMASPANRFAPGLRCEDYVLKYDQAILDEFESLVGGFERDMHAAARAEGKDGSPWGWKGPTSFNFLDLIKTRYEGFRYVHVVRHGLDMAFSGNTNQLRRWGWRYGLDGELSPPNQLRYWICANRQALFDARRLGIDLHVINFDRMCADPVSGVRDLLAFLGVETDRFADLVALVAQPDSIGRRHRFDLGFVDSDAREALAELGFAP